MNLNSEEVKDLRVQFKDIIASLDRVEAEKSLQKETLEVIKDKFDIKPAVTRKIARMYMKSNKDEEENKLDETISLYVALFEQVGN